jgi:tRNA dimethylallyltransferase
MRSSAEWSHPPIWDAWYLTGPTASGKSGLALALAQRLDAEIVSLDSMAVYKYMDVGTAKPTAEQRALVQHHLIDLVEPNDDYSLSCFVQDAHRVYREIKGRGKEVLFVGGTPLYLKSLLRGMFQGPPADWEFRKQVEEDVEQHGIEELRKRLWQVDPLTAHKLHPNDVRRMIRALEVAKILGQPLSHLQAQFENGLPADRVRVFVLGLDRAWLHQRINERVDKMFAQGLVDEVRGLLERYGSLKGTARQAVGYKEVIQFLNDEFNLATAVEQVKAHTRQFARRQEIWFRSLSECRRLDVLLGGDMNQLMEEMIELGSNTMVPAVRR